MIRFLSILLCIAIVSHIAGILYGYFVYDRLDGLLPKLQPRMKYLFWEFKKIDRNRVMGVPKRQFVSAYNRNPKKCEWIRESIEAELTYLCGRDIEIIFKGEML